MWCLNCLPLDQISDCSSRTVAVYSLLCDVIRTAGQSPRDVPKVPALWQFLHWLAQLELPGLVRNGVSVGGGQLAWAGLSTWTATLPFYPGRLVQVYLAAYRPGATLRQVVFVVPYLIQHSDASAIVEVMEVR